LKLKLHDSLIIYFSSSLLQIYYVSCMLLTVRNWISWSVRPFMVGHVEDELSLVISTEILLTAVLESFELYVAFSSCFH
jgi:hypothetical protein